MTKQQVSLEAIKYVSRSAIDLIEAAREGTAPDLLKRKPPRGVRFIEAWYCPEGPRGPIKPQKGTKLTASGEVQDAYWRMQFPKPREGAEFQFGDFVLHVVRGRKLDSRVVPVRVQEPGKPPRLALYVGWSPNDSQSIRAKTRAEKKELEWSRYDALMTCYIPRAGEEEGWSPEDLDAQIAWWAAKKKIASPETDAFLERYANSVWPGHGASVLFDENQGSFKAPLSPLAAKAYISVMRRLPDRPDEPSSEITFPAKPEDMVRVLEEFGIGVRMIYRDAEAGKIPVRSPKEGAGASSLSRENTFARQSLTTRREGFARQS